MTTIKHPAPTEPDSTNALPVTQTTPPPKLTPPVLAKLTRDIDEAERSKLVSTALRACQRAVDIIDAALASGDCDIDDAVRALPVLHRAIEHAEKLDAGISDGPTQAPLIFNIERAQLTGVAIDVRSGRKPDKT